jgi:hypothetical protein
MKTDTALQCEAMGVLVQTFGMVDAERFISMIKRDTFDYTEWRRGLWEDMPLDEIYDKAAAHYEKNKD